VCVCACVLMFDDAELVYDYYAMFSFIRDFTPMVCVYVYVSCILVQLIVRLAFSMSRMHLLMLMFCVWTLSAVLVAQTLNVRVHTHAMHRPQSTCMYACIYTYRGSLSRHLTYAHTCNA
jgi:hypothetical protein